MVRNIFHDVLLFFIISLFLGSSSGISAATPIKADGRLNYHMPFISNEGQLDAQVKYYAKTFGGTVFVTGDGQLVYSLSRKGKTAVVHKPSVKSNLNKNKLVQGQNIAGISLKEELVGGKIAGVKGEGAAAAKVNYFRGSDGNKWKTNLSTYDLVDLGEVYDGIQLKLRAYGNNVEKLFYVKPGAKPEDIKVKLTGARSLEIGDTGELAVETNLGTVSFTRPVAYQEIGGKRVEIAANYFLLDSQSSSADSGRIYGFRLGDYDKTRDVVIDPLLYSTYLGGSGSDLGLAIKVDSLGNIYVAGVTGSSNFPTTAGAFDRDFNGGNTDFFISKISPAGGLVYSTFIGGSADDYDSGSYDNTYAFGMAIDASGNVYMSGNTRSADFPTTAGAFSRTLKGGADSFVLKMNTAGNALLYSTLIGGSGDDIESGLAVDADGNAYIAGTTHSLDFPATPGAFMTTFQGGTTDMFAVKLNPTGSSLIYATYIGGSTGPGCFSCYEDAGDIAIDGSGNAYIVGGGEAADFPTTPGAYDRTFNDNRNVYVVKLKADGSSLLASTFLGGVGEPWAQSVALDNSGNVFVSGDIGAAANPDFPTTPGAYNTHCNSAGDFFYSKFDASLSTLLASTCGISQSGAFSLATDNSGNVYIAGGAFSSSFPTTPGAYDTTFHGGVSNGGLLIDAFCSPSGGCDAFVSKLDNNLTTLLASTLLGGSGNEFVMDIALDSAGKVYVAGSTTSADFPVKDGFDSSHNGSEDVFVAVLDPDLSADSSFSILTVTKSGTGSGTVTADSGTINWNGSTGTASYSPGTSVMLTAAADSGSTFTGWTGGGCSGTGACTVVMNAGTAVTATFTAETTYTYTISPANKSFKANGGNVTVKVSGTSQNSPAPLVTINDAWLSQSGTMSWKNSTGKVKIAVQKNTSSQSRTGVVWIGGNALAIEEIGAPCKLTAVKPSSGKFTNAGGTGSFDVSVSPQDCAWNITTASNWVHLDTSAGTGDGNVVFHIDTNTTGKNRTGKIDASLATNVKKIKSFSAKQSK
jgi:hypothetical protein